MSLICPQCSGSCLEITKYIELPPDSISDEITLQILRCKNCRFEALGVFQESRRGRLDADSFSHRGYRCAQADLTRIKKLISACPAKRDHACRCRSHLELGLKDSSGRWVGPPGLDYTQEFFIEW